MITLFWTMGLIDELLSMFCRPPQVGELLLQVCDALLSLLYTSVITIPKTVIALSIVTV